MNPAIASKILKGPDGGPQGACFRVVFLGAKKRELCSHSPDVFARIRAMKFEEESDQDFEARRAAMRAVGDNWLRQEVSKAGGYGQCIAEAEARLQMHQECLAELTTLFDRYQAVDDMVNQFLSQPAIESELAAMRAHQELRYKFLYTSRRSYDSAPLLLKELCHVLTVQVRNAEAHLAHYLRLQSEDEAAPPATDLIC